ncbi:glycosyltransferase family 4 protein [Bacillus sp. PS06]|uniref:glycosyltransferase family 4 protein n=1 Tax=Bacillus sp. PS06 TaxID=2764176 RepID=UPI001780F2C6|nr:glycosyltransferase family 4 protein [Bacillus sp. PS06]MBD8070544.1 glycosyltransferase family 4 protein [Bacillus sp. PS06]
MNILLTTIFEYPHEGGLSTHMSTLKRGLEERGHKVDVLSFTDMNPLVRKSFAQAPGFIVNKFKRGRGQVMNDSNRRRLLSMYIRNLKQHYDVINSQDVYAALASIDSGIPTVATVHGYFSFEAISRGAIEKGSEEDERIQVYEKNAYQKAAQVVTVDKRIKDYVMEKAGVEAITIKNFIDVSSFEINAGDHAAIRKEFQIPEDVYVLFVPRRLTEKNGVIYPTLALPDILKKHPKTMLVYAGTGEQMETIKQKTEELGLINQVKMLGSVPHEKMKQLYSIATVVLVPSIHSHGVEEATSISALEAMGSGSPVVAGAVGGLKEIFSHQEDGLLVEERNVQQLSEAVIQLLDEPSFAQTLATKAREKVINKYSHQAAAERFEEIYVAASSQVYESRHG